MKDRASNFRPSPWLAAVVASVLTSTQTARAASPDFLWAKAGAPINSANLQATADAYSVAADAAGNVFVAGSFTDAIRIGSTNLYARNRIWDDIFVAKFDRDGGMLWVRTAGGIWDDYAFGMVLDPVGNCYVMGSFDDIVNFGSLSITNYSGGLFLAKYDTQGNLVWLKQGAGGSVQGSGLAIDQRGNLFVTGTFTGTAFFDNLSISTPAGFNIFVAKYNTNGTAVWVRQASPDSSGWGREVAVDQSGNCYISGFFTTAATFDGITLTASNQADGIFLVRYDPAGNVEWARKGAGPRPPGGPVTDAGNGLGLDRFGNVYLSGIIGGPTTFDQFSLTNFTLGSIFLAKYDPSGNVLWLRQGGGTSGGDRSYGSAVDTSGDVYLTGYLVGTAVFDGNSFTSPEGGYNAFIAKYDSEGRFRGLLRARGSGDSYGYATAVDPSGNCYLTGIVGKTPALFGTNILSSLWTTRTFFVAKVEPFAPTLKITRNPGQVVLAWSPWATNYQLETASTLLTPIAWSAVTNRPFLVAGENVATNATSNSQSFFRLIKQ